LAAQWATYGSRAMVIPIEELETVREEEESLISL
jgi:hypothetical protein